MTKKKLILISGLIVLCLLVCLAFAMCSGKSEGPGVDAPSTQATSGGETGTREYTIEIKNEGGQPLEEIGVYIYTDSTMQELVWFAKTDAQGRLNFRDAASDSFVAVLSNVSAGYLVEEWYPLTGELTRIVLEAGMMEGNLNELNYKLGDLMLDFTATAPDGTEYTLSKLLEEKKAIVLNFWYLQCDPCKSEFPYLQEAYEQYDEDVIVLAMNPVNSDQEEIEQFRKDNGYTFPMMACDSAWEKAMGVTAYPTTVVIDRFGNICMIHKGAVTEAETFETIFSFFSAEDYKQTFVKDLEELEEAAGVEQVLGTPDNPVEMGVTQSFQVTVEPGQSMHYNVYRITGVIYLTVNDPTVTVTYNGVTYSNNVSIGITSEGTTVAVPLIFGNTGTETKTYNVYMGRAAGSYNNPYALKLGEVTAKVGAGNETGVYYTYTAKETGLFKITVQKVTPEVDYNIVAYNLTTYAFRQSQDNTADEETGYKSVGVNVNKGDQIQMIVGTLPDSSNSYPAATFQLNVEVREGESEGTTQQQLITYAVNVTDADRKPLPNVMMTLKTDASNVTMTTNKDGYASTKQKAGIYTVILTVPNGYTARTTEFLLTEQYPSVSLKLDKLIVEEQTYTIRVLDAQGQPIAGAFVSIGTAYGETDENGIAVITVAKGTYTAVISADGYALGEIEVSPDNAEADVSLEEGESVPKQEYTVKTVDYFGQPVANVSLTVKQDGVIRGSLITDEDGKGSIALVPGTYTVATADRYYTQEAQNVLTEENRSVTLCVVAPVTGEVGDIYGNDTYILYPGATYVSGLQSNTDNYFLFVPEVDGVYQVTGLYSNASLSYWGNNTNFLMNHTSQTDYSAETNSMTVNIKPGHLGSSFIFGLTGDTEGVILIQRIGDAILDITDMEETNYEARNTIDQNFSLKLEKGQSLTYVDVFGPDVSVVKGSDGLYHLNSATGPVLYVNLSDSAPYLSMSKCMGVTDEHAIYKLVYVYYDEAGNPVKKESYNACMVEYVKAACDKTGVYPLNEDLIFMFQQGSQIKGWGDYDSYDFLFYDANHEKLPGVNESIAWMYACCYVE